MHASLVLEDFLSRYYNLTFILSFIVVFFQMIHNNKLQWEGTSLSIGPLYKVQRTVINFPNLVRKKKKPPKIVQKF